ncbi:MAG: universal stress protein [Burkholderiaceae bacterium]|nr:universal stress protein [Burkholderiaceae bacterium]
MLSPKSILLHLDSSPQAEQRIRMARHVAEVFNAQVTALYCITTALLRYPFALEGAATALSMMDELDKEAKKSAQAMFEKACAGSSRLKWSESKNATGATWEFIRRAFYADLLILGQQEEGHFLNEELPFDFLTNVLIQSGRPALIVPYVGFNNPVAQTILLAWKPTREAARAVSAALPWLYQAKNVHLVCYGTEPKLPLGALSVFLKAHGISAILHQGGSDSVHAGEHLLSLAADVQADLLVMGCYGHTRARQWVFGGVSHSVLRAMTVPVLMVH